MARIAIPPAVMDDAGEGGRPVAWRRRKDRRAPEILERARALIEEEGAADVSMARIAKAAGVSEATVYNYFENKQDLVNQVLRAWAQPFIDTLTAELAPLTELRSRLVLIAIRYLRSMEQTPRLHRVFYTEIRWANYRGSEIHKLNNRFVRSIMDTIGHGIVQGELDGATDPAMFRDMLFGGLEHIAQRTLFAGRTLDIEAEAARYVDLMLLGAKPRTATDMTSELRRLSALVDRLERRLPA
ncbi:MAG: TetR/AcrR family transcriptional regulator [Sphingomonadales bacterium]|nr:MAG: TetR/AcrR family transcriptional regulator [Sphingomonadales bacterium]